MSKWRKGENSRLLMLQNGMRWVNARNVIFGFLEISQVSVDIGLMCVCVLDERVEAVKMEMQSTVDRLESELAELQQSRQSLQHDSTLQLESLDRLRRDNAELQQRVSTIFSSALMFYSMLVISLCEAF